MWARYSLYFQLPDPLASSTLPRLVVSSPGYKRRLLSSCGGWPSRRPPSPPHNLPCIVKHCHTHTRGCSGGALALLAACGRNGRCVLPQQPGNSWCPCAPIHRDERPSSSYTSSPQKGALFASTITSELDSGSISLGVEGGDLRWCPCVTDDLELVRPALFRESILRLVLSRTPWAESPE